ncbi:dolichol kinase isoform X2 [Eurytemora carolleeae]|nr:dolichol kinase isoform X2 [Eurytemora carolleeae]XP_023333334.1 dolichol kinase isoform X2 [Eurytemora carolleeae]XP_023333335.1 dolichol kinase isoform X2 [Eurytemora carolleeae]XP_023333336.1 dolichol kinase isoform X2 [Eurytemora carolleeae]|eukprot:XP_023333333.1 dolichol kinase-like isoform X2 [Eurytemora affinis]
MNSRISDLRPMQGGVSGVYGTDGICAVLLPLSILVPGVRSDLSIISLSLSLSSLLLYILDYRPTGSSAAFSLLSFLPAWLCIVLLPDLQTDSRFRLYLCFWTVLVYRPVFNNIVSRFKKSFTFGEACIVVQGGILAAYTFINRLYMQGVFRRIELAKQVVKWIDWFIDHYSTPSSILLISSWIVLGVLSVCVVVVYKHKGWPVHSRTRKLFHLAVILVYVPGLIVNPDLLYIASLGATTLFISLEALRYSGKLPRLTRPLTAHLEHFADNKEGKT